MTRGYSPNKKTKGPRSIEFNPEVRAKYKTARAYWFAEDPVYRQFIIEQTKAYRKKRIAQDPDYYKKQQGEQASTMKPETYEKIKESNKKRYQADKEFFTWRFRDYYKFNPPEKQKHRPHSKSLLSPGLELREESSD